MPAFAKINLSLRVLGTRPDGYHELRTVFQSIALHDTLTILRRRGPFRLECDDPACPADSTNLVARAALAVWRASRRRGEPRDIIVRLAKRIPMAAGLGGGSSDGAAAIRAFARLWHVDEARLPAIAASIGADVPYFLEGGTVLGLERGDLLFPLVDRPRAWVTLVIPSFGVTTKDAYGWFDRDGARGSRPGARRSREGVAPDEAANDLQPAVARRHPEISRIVSALQRAGASHAAMTGSGSAVFGLFAARPPARTRAFVDQVCALARQLGKRRLEIGDLVGHVMHTRPSFRQEAADGGVLPERLEQLDAALADTDGRRPDSLISYCGAVLDLRAEQPLVGHEGRIEVLDRNP